MELSKGRIQKQNSKVRGNSIIKLKHLRIRYHNDIMPNINVLLCLHVKDCVC